MKNALLIDGRLWTDDDIDKLAEKYLKKKTNAFLGRDTKLFDDCKMIIGIINNLEPLKAQVDRLRNLSIQAHSGYSNPPITDYKVEYNFLTNEHDVVIRLYYRQESKSDWYEAERGHLTSQDIILPDDWDYIKLSIPHRDVLYFKNHIGELNND